MNAGTERILTTHAGSLSRPADLIALGRARASGEKIDEAAYGACLATSVADVVRKQRELGIDIPDDGEFGKPVAGSYDYGAWWNYAFARMSGFSPASAAHGACRHAGSSVAEVALTSFANRRDWQTFGEFYQDPESSGSLLGSAARRPVARPACIGPIRYTGQAALAADIANLKKAMAASGVEEAFMCAIGPGSFARGEDFHYKTEEEFLFASADAMREEYKAIVEAGIVLQIDDPSLSDNWDMINPEPPLSEFKKFEQVRVEALNHALRGLPPERIRYHICWGSWHGPHITDIPLADIVDLVLSVNAGAYSVEAGNVRHEHEWRVWQDVERQAAHSGRGEPRHQYRRASAGGRRPHCALRGRGRARERNRRNRLRAGRPHPSTDRLGQAQGIVRRRCARHARALAIVPSAVRPCP
jgi:5-methyltetrahydropteroyltriglutamate--homocysteine methyltransferase